MNDVCEFNAITCSNTMFDRGLYCAFTSAQGENSQRSIRCCGYIFPVRAVVWLSFTLLAFSRLKAAKAQLQIPRQFGLSPQSNTCIQFHCYDLPTFLVVLVCALSVDQAGGVICTEQLQPGHPGSRNDTLQSTLSEYVMVFSQHVSYTVQLAKWPC